MPAQAPSRIGPPPVHLHDDASLERTDGAGIAGLARLFTSSAHLADAVAQDLRGTATHLSGGDWTGHAATAFGTAAAHIHGDLRGAVTALAHGAAVLDRLSWAVAEAQARAARASADAADINAAIARLNAAWDAENAAGATHPSLGLRLQADDLDTRAAVAHREMDDAAQQAHHAFAQAAAAFDGIAETAPALRAALQRGAERHQPPRALQVLEGIGSLALGVVGAVVDGALGASDIAQAGLDPITDGATVADTEATVSAFGTAVADLTGAAATESIGAADDILANPALLNGQSPGAVRNLLGDASGWKEGTLGRGSREGQGWVMREHDAKGDLTGGVIRWHPGGGRHGPDPYWRVSSAAGGKSDMIPGGPDDLGAWWDVEAGG